MKLTQLLFNMLQEVIITPQSEHYPKFRYQITNLLETIHTEEDLRDAVVCDVCMRQRDSRVDMVYNICSRCSEPIDVCLSCLGKASTKFGHQCVCYPCRSKNGSSKL